jgi:hypothetical protein
MSGENSELLLDVPGNERRRAGRILERCGTLDLLPDLPRSCEELPAATVFVVERGFVVISSGTESRRLVVAVGSPAACSSRPAGTRTRPRSSTPA